MPDETLIQKITAAHARDQMSDFVARTAEHLPLSYDSITKGWLSAVLCGAVPGAAVAEFRLGVPDEGSSNRRRISVRYNAAGEAAGLPQHLFCKATHGLLNRLALGLAGAVQSEIFFYNYVRDLLPLEAPVCFHAGYDPDSLNSIVMLGDLGLTAREFCTHTTVMDRARAESQMRLLGTLHGYGYGNAAVRRAIEPLGTWLDFFNRTKDFGLDDGARQGFIDGEAVIPARLYKRGAEIWPATERATGLADKRPATLAHGDVHLKNWYVAGSGEMGLADWQCLSRGHWGRDFAYTVSTALTVEDRRAWERELLALYLDAMAAEGGPLVPFAEAWDIYREQLFGALAWWTVTLSPPPNMPEMQPRDTALEFVKRISTAMDDLDSFGALAVHA